MNSQCYSVEKAISYYLDVISNQYYNQFPSLVINIGKGGSFFSNVEFDPTSSTTGISSINLFRFNITLIGINDENGNQVSISNNNSIPIFIVQPQYLNIATNINFINLNYGGDCLTAANGSSNGSLFVDNGDLIQVEASYNFGLSISFIDFNYSCQSNDKTLVLVNGAPNINYSPSEEWENYSNNVFPTTSYSFSFINSIFSSTPQQQQHLMAPIFNSTFCPLTLSIIKSTFNNNIQPYSPAFIHSNGQLIVEKSTFISSNNSQLECLESVFQIYNVEVYFNENQVVEWPVHQNKLIECNGCFFTGVSNTMSTSFYSTNKECSLNNPTLLSFDKSSATIMNSNLTMTNLNGYPNTIQRDVSLIYGTGQSQISLRSNLITSTIGSVLNYNSVKSFMFSNVFSNSFEPFIHCSSKTYNIFNGDKFSLDISNLGYNCNKNLETQKINASLLFTSIGIVITIGSLGLLYIARYAIKRCSGPLNDYNHIKSNY